MAPASCQRTVLAWPWCNLAAPNEAFFQRYPQSRDRPIKWITHRALQWQIRKAIWFSFSTLQTCPHTALTFTQALTFMRESDERNELLTKKMLRVLCDILLFLINPMHREDTFAYLPTTSFSKKLNHNRYYISSFEWTIMRKCHTPLWPA